MISPTTDIASIPSASLALTRIEPPAGRVLLDPDGAAAANRKLADMSSALEHLSKVGALAGALGKRQAIERVLALKAEGIRHMEGILATAPVPAETLSGREAERVMSMAKDVARRHGGSVPPPPGSTFIFGDGEWVYTIHGDGKVTRSRNGVPTPEQWKATSEALERRRSEMAADDHEAELAALDRQIAGLRAELGPSADDEVAGVTEAMAKIMVDA